MTLVVAHRGASAAHPPGNTEEAFRAAATQGADWVELDVRPCADGHLAVHHDPDLPDGRTIADLGADELPAWVPSLADALDACVGMGVNVELKADAPAASLGPMVDGVVAELRRRGDLHRWLVTSFDWGLVGQVRSLAPDLATGLLLFDPGLVDSAVAEAGRSGHVAVNPWDPLVDEALVRRAHDGGLAVNVWTVDDLDRIVELAGFGVDAVITNRPDAARAALSGG